MSRFTSRLFGLALAALASTPAVTAQTVPFETMRSDYRNLRGFNYLATYRTLNVSGASYNGLAWEGVASSTAMWEYYDTSIGGTAELVDEQLGWLKAIGVNTVRVFLSYPCWLEHETPNGNVFIDRFEHFLKLCELNGIYCIPVIWDNTLAGATNPPDLEDYFSSTNFHAWHSNPGIDTINDVVAAPNIKQTGPGKYLKAISEAAYGEPAFLMWDLVNEFAGVSPADMEVFVKKTLDVLESLHPEQDTMLGLIFSQASLPYSYYLPLNELATEGRIDVHAVHNYAASRDALRSFVWDATHILIDPADPSQGTHVPKHVIATENGSPGDSYHYADGLRHALNVRRDELGPGELGLGTLSFSSNVGWNEGRYPFMTAGGLFYPDGTVRDLATVAAFMNTAIAQGHTPPGIPGLTQKQPGDPGFVLQGADPTYVSMNWDERAEHVTLMWTPPDGFDDLAPTLWDYFDILTALDWLNTSVRTPAIFSAKNNGNPYGVGSSEFDCTDGTGNPAFSVLPCSVAEDIDDWRDAIQLTPTGSYPPFVSTPLTMAIEAASTSGGPFDPANNAEHLELLANGTLYYYVDLLRPYVLFQDDNSDQ